MKGLNKLKKLLCYLIISIFVFGIGGEVVKAANEMQIDKVIWIDETQYNKFDVWLYGQYRYAYCIDPPVRAPSPTAWFNLMSQSQAGISDYQKQRMIRVLMAAGYPTYNYAYLGVGDRDDYNAYKIVQAALWYAQYGEKGTWLTYTNYTHNYMYNTYASYGKLMAVADGEADPIDKITVLSIHDNHGNTMTLDSENNLLVSDSTFSISGVDRYKLQLEGTGAYVTVDGVRVDDLNNYVFTQNSTFKVVIDLNVAGAGEHTASFRAVQEGYTPTYDLEFFYNSPSLQRMTLLVPRATNPAEASYQVMGNVEMRDVPFAKTNTNGDYIAGAVLEIYTSDDKLVATIDTEDYAVTVPLPQGSYYLTEFTNPSGYWFNSDKVYFDVDSLGNASVGGNAVSVVSISDEEAFISLKKVSIPTSEGIKENIAGATFLIYSPNDDVNAYICGKTDSNGFITVEDSETCNSVLGTYGLTGKRNLAVGNSTGVYSLLDLKFNKLMSEYDLIVKELKSAYGYLLDNKDYHISGPFDERIGWYYGENGPAGDVTKQTIDGKNVTVFEFSEQRYINISKTNAGGEEIAGATLKVCRKAPDGECSTGISPTSDHTPVYDDYWVSEAGESHKFAGIEKNVMYILEEELAPDGYVQIKGKIDFMLVDDIGTVKVYNHETGEEIENSIELGFAIPNKPIEVYISKKKVGGGPEIEGAHLKICTSANYLKAQNISGDGNNCDAEIEWISEADNPKKIEGLKAGDYYLIETIAPRGFKLTSAAFFTVSNDPDVVNSKTMENTPITVVISKKDQATGERLAGAHFEILNASDRTIATDYNDKELVWTSDGENDWEIEGLPKGDYILVETQKPEGFQSGMIIDGELVNEYNFTISDGISDLKIDAYIQVMNAPNTGISTLNLFAIGGLLVFAGYETIKIYRKKALND